MRTRARSRMGVSILFAFFCLGIFAQESSPQAFWVHEDVVHPAMISEYETVCKELTGALSEHEIPFNTLVAQTTDNRYLWVSPIDGMADIDNFSAFKELSEKMGADKMGSLFARMDKCYDVEQDYIIYLDPELSYMPDGMTQTPEGKDFRRFHYLYYTPADRKAVRDRMQAVKDLFASKSSDVHYRVYRSGFGTRGEFYMVAVASADPVQEATMSAANGELLGTDGQQTMSELMGILHKYEEFRGRMRPDMVAASQ